MATPDLDNIRPIPEWNPFLRDLVRSLPENLTILEIGTYLGGTTVRMAEERPDARIITVDCCDTEQWLPPYDEYSNNTLIAQYGITPSEQTMRINLSRFDNIEFIKGFSPDDFIDFNTPVDLYFEDGDHGEPLESMENFLHCVKPGGYFVAHDYGMKWVKMAVDEIYERGGWEKTIWTPHFGNPPSQTAMLKRV